MEARPFGVDTHNHIDAPNATVVMRKGDVAIRCGRVRVAMATERLGDRGEGAVSPRIGGAFELRIGKGIAIAIASPEFFIAEGIR